MLAPLTMLPPGPCISPPTSYLAADLVLFTYRDIIHALRAVAIALVHLVGVQQ
jgi:hypothetical protein